MKLKRINTIYFSPTGGTAEIVRFIARELAALLHLEEREIDLTRPENRKMQLQLGCDELLIMASPVYAGRLPNKLLPDYHALLHGEGTPSVAVCTFGNRSCDEALRELVMLLEGNNFHVAVRLPLPAATLFPNVLAPAGRMGKIWPRCVSSRRMWRTS